MAATDLEGPWVAEIVAIYAGLVFDVRHFARGCYTIGDGPLVSFPLLSPALPDPGCFPLVRCEGDATWLHFTVDMRGELVEVTGRSSFDVLIASGRARPVDGAFTVELAPGARAEIRVEAVTFVLRRVPPARDPARAQGLDRYWGSHVGFG